MDVVKVVLGWFKDNDFVVILVLLIFLDIITGVMAAFINQKVSSITSFRGMLKKTGILGIMSLAYLLDPYVDLPLTDICAVFYIVSEGLSILENLGSAGVPIPETMRSALTALKGRTNAKDSVPPIEPATPPESVTARDGSGPDDKH